MSTVMTFKKYVFMVLCGCFVTFIAWAKNPSLLSMPNVPSERSVTSVYSKAAWGRVHQWQVLMKKLEGKSVNVKLHAVNDFFNQMSFLDDEQVWHVKDYWATPFEFLGVGAGDCEDFAMAKYYSLRESGVPEDQLRLNYVKYIPFDQFHMVVTWAEKMSDTRLVLDNIDKKIKPAPQRNDLAPIYSFNGNSLWVSKLDGDGEPVGGAGRLSVWGGWQSRLKAGSLRKPTDGN